MLGIHLLFESAKFVCFLFYFRVFRGQIGTPITSVVLKSVNMLMLRFQHSNKVCAKVVIMGNKNEFIYIFSTFLLTVF